MVRAPRRWARSELRLKAAAAVHLAPCSQVRFEPVSVEVAPTARTGTGPPATGSTKPRCSIRRSSSPKAIRDSAKDGALIRYRFWPAMGKSPSDAQTYHELRPPESSLPGSPPRPSRTCC